MARYASARLVRCQSCSLVFAGDLPTSSELDDHYSRYRPSANCPLSPFYVTTNCLTRWTAFTIQAAYSISGVATDFSSLLLGDVGGPPTAANSVRDRDNGRWRMGSMFAMRRSQRRRPS